MHVIALIAATDAGNLDTRKASKKKDKKKVLWQ